MERYCVKVEDRRSDMRDPVPVIYSGDRYFDDQGFMYVVVLNPSIVDEWGMTGTKEKVDIKPEEASPTLDKPNLKLRRINDMISVNTDNIFLGLYKYDRGEHATYYQCEEPLLKELTDEKKLYVFTYGEDVKTELIMTDKYGRSYVNVGPKELARYTYFERPLPNYYFTPPRPEPVVRQTESMEYPVFPNTRPVLPESRPMESVEARADATSDGEEQAEYKSRIRIEKSTSMTRASALADKAKFTVFVRGRQWSSARHIHETLQEFARVIEKNAKRLGFINQDDKVERLQLARSADGTDPEELDVDATLEDVLICMDRKQLIALINPAGQAELCTSCPTHAADMCHADHPTSAMPTDTDPPTVLNSENVVLAEIPHRASNYSLATPTSAPSSRKELNQTPSCTRVSAPESPNIGIQSIKSQPQTCPQFVSKIAYSPTKSQDLPQEGAFRRTTYAKDLRISIPNTDLDQIGSPTNLLGNNCQAPSLATSNYHQNILLPNTAQHPSLTASSSTELAQLLVKTSSVQPSQYLNAALSAGSVCVGNNPFLQTPLQLFDEILELPHPQALPPTHTLQSFNSLAPTGWINNCPEPIHPIQPMIATANSFKLPTPNIAILAQFLASQLRAFMPTESNQSTSVPPTMHNEPMHSSSTQSAMRGNALQTLQHCKEAKSLTAHVSLANISQPNNGSLCSHLDPANCTIESRSEKDQSSSSVIEAQQNAQSQPEMIFLVNRRSKTGTGTHRLKMSELSTYFHLSVVDAAKKLGVSQTTLKKACRKFGLKRWPGRKVRSLESTIHGLEHTIAVGQGAGMEELTEAQIRSEVLKLQQEMDHLVHGLPSMQVMFE
ncbi:hypothetical protein L7F22_050904 [Adiantum nelumboides]|nr:hypothetical protein [Adiantum nelumboides]